MSTVVIEHVPVTELPAAWQERLEASPAAKVTIRIEPEVGAQASVMVEDDVPPEFADDPIFGMWRDREDMADVEGYIRRIRASRY